jgi:hypothetical protein
MYRIMMMTDGFWYWYLLTSNTNTSYNPAISQSSSSSSAGTWTRQSYSPFQPDAARGKVVNEEEEELADLEASTHLQFWKSSQSKRSMQ